MIRRALTCLAFGVAVSAEGRLFEVDVLARVAGRVVTDRSVYLDALFEQPELYKPGARGKDLPVAVRTQGLQRVITQSMILEENRLVGREAVSEEESLKALAAFRKRLGKDYPLFLTNLELTEAEVRERLGQKVLVEKILAARIAAANIGEARPQKDGTLPKREELVRKAIDDWLKQLRSRYRVQYLKDEAVES